MNLQNLRKSISQMSPDESMDLVMTIRNSRHTRKATRKKTQKPKVYKKKQTDNIISRLTASQKEKLLKGLLGS